MINLEQHGQWMQADTQTPVSLYLSLVGTKPGILLESTEVDGRLGRYSLMGWDFQLLLECFNGNLKVTVLDDRLAPLQTFHDTPFLKGIKELTRELNIIPPAELSELPPMTRSICGYFGYTMGGIFEPALADRLPPEQGEAYYALPGKILLFDHLHSRCCYLSITNDPNPGPLSAAPVEEEPLCGRITATPDRSTFMDAVTRAKKLITHGEAIQIVLSSKRQCSFTGSSFTLYRRLRQINPSPYTFYIHFPEITLIGSSPELLVKSTDNHLLLRPIAGTRPRGASDEEDKQLAAEMIEDPKERAEHVMLVDLGRNDLGRMATTGSVKVTRFMDVERFSHVMHLTSTITADLLPGRDALDVLTATFPAGTVSGAPKIRAMQIIADMELLERGPYAGSIGWIGVGQGPVNLDMGLTIRTMWIRDGVLTWQTGAGIVFDSEPVREWEECQNKAGALFAAIQTSGGGDDFTRGQL
ncbi:anthranilate synthase component I family protein [Desulfoplanes formicivorans]|uniref:Anthranilate synthase n=1 Tax=Desulfoplanes formicivorans TaxID=1592317 RepID=A0A194AHB2_9BACT|nr:anthranilate synthase component I family protein [Desulfoplanes formicivorans]GAU09472.1 anthranilate synthase [Desulfoplanes formicivorans]